MSDVSVHVPGETIGILGGGQLGRMIILEGRKMGYRFVTFDPTEDCPAAQVADQHFVAAYDDLEKALEFASHVDLILYEFESIDPALVKELENKTLVPQGSYLLQTAGHRLYEKSRLSEAEIPVTPFYRVENSTELEEATAELGFPSVLKTVTGGYDGKGQWMLHSREDVDALPAELLSSGKTFLLEKFVSFTKEISVIVARNERGEVSVYPPVMNIHRRHILHMTLAPAPISAEVNAEAKKLAEQIAERLQMVGLIGVEMFLLPDGSLLVNELAPRPHNSGHFSYDACYTSQFEQLLRSVTNLPLHNPELIQPAVMVNLLGEHKEKFLQELPHLPQEMKVHWYGKKEAKTGRKMGHVTLTAPTLMEAIEKVESVPIWSPLTEKEKTAIQS